MKRYVNRLRRSRQIFVSTKIEERMQKTFVKTDFKVTAFSAINVIFDDSDLVSMRVKCRVGTQLIQTNLLFTFNKFNDLLRFSSVSGEELQLMVSDKLLGKDEPPYIIELPENKLVFTTCSLDVSYLIEGDETCFSVEEIMPLSLIQQAKNLQINVRDFSNVKLQQDILNRSLQEAAAQYRYYLGLLELQISEAAAREKAGLSNEKLFKIAYHANKISNAK